ncbi:MAG: preprotein translocase subunit SecG [Paludibacteraceae bacterium]|nr:preprotein translocase subunit SecG [Paludibacteraceae bacterium]
MGQVLSVVIVILSIVLVLFVLVQNSKGGGLASNFSNGNQMLGVRKTTDALEKITWSLVAIIVVLCIASSSMSKTTVATASEVSDQVEIPAQGGAVPEEAPVEVPAE